MIAIEKERQKVMNLLYLLLSILKNIKVAPIRVERPAIVETTRGISASMDLTYSSIFYFVRFYNKVKPIIPLKIIGNFFEYFSIASSNFIAIATRYRGVELNTIAFIKNITDYFLFSILALINESNNG